MAVFVGDIYRRVDHSVIQERMPIEDENLQLLTPLALLAVRARALLRYQFALLFFNYQIRIHFFNLFSGEEKTAPTQEATEEFLTGFCVQLAERIVDDRVRELKNEQVSLIFPISLALFSFKN